MSKIYADVTLEELLDEDREAIDDIEANIDDLVSEVEDQYGDYETFVEDAPAYHVENVEATFDDLQARKEEQEQQVERTEELIEDLKRDPEDVPDNERAWGGTEFRLRSLVTHDLAEVQDQMGATIESERDLENVEGAAMMEVVDRMVEKSPPGAPESPGEYPPLVTKLLANKGGEISGLGATEGDVGNSSLRQRMGS